MRKRKSEDISDFALGLCVTEANAIAEEAFFAARKPKLHMTKSFTSVCIS